LLGSHAHLVEELPHRHIEALLVHVFSLLARLVP
jgi:hypothetical protein